MVKKILLDSIKIPNYLTLVYLNTKSILIFKFKRKVLVVNTSKFCLTIIKNNLVSLNYSNISSLKLKLYLIEIESSINQKINLFGIGYKIFEILILTKKILLLKLGFSHFIYYKVPEKFRVFVIKYTQLCAVACDSYFSAIQNLAIIKSFKKPDTFKGKGFRFTNEKIHLKLGKKV
jgi:hypothetical protein